jgi:hypothetical protein
MGAPAVGSIGWIDLTVEDAPRIRDFYKEIAGWTAQDVDMGGYADYAMVPPGGSAAVAGVCHARGQNTGLPVAWLIYVTVADVERAAKRVVELGGKLRREIREVAGGRFCVIEDPAGAVCALYQPPPSP